MQFLAGNAVGLLENGEQYFPALEAAIEDATREIFLQSYIFDDDRTGQRIALALERADGAEQGADSRQHRILPGGCSGVIPG